MSGVDQLSLQSYGVYRRDGSPLVYLRFSMTGGEAFTWDLTSEFARNLARCLKQAASGPKGCAHQRRGDQ